MKISDIIVKFLKLNKVDTVFALPGEENLDLLESLSDNNIKLVITHHESSAGFMAANYSRLTGNLGVCLTTVGPGITNAISAVAYSKLLGISTLFISAGKAQGINQGYFQDIPTTEILKPLTNTSIVLTSEFDCIAVLNNLYKSAFYGKKGPVHLELPDDIAGKNVSDSLISSLSKINYQPTYAPKKLIEKISSLIVDSKKPILILGTRANNKNISKKVSELIVKFGFYAVTTQMGKGAIDESLNNFLGTIAFTEDDYLHDELKLADLFIYVGVDTAEKAQFKKSDKAKIVNIDSFFSREYSEFIPDFELIGDIEYSCRELSDILISKNVNFYESFIHSKELLNERIYNKSLKDQSPKSIEKIITQISDHVSNDSIVALDNGLYKVWFARNFLVSNPQTLLLDNHFATMGAGLSSSIVAGLLNRDKRTYAIVGDGGLLMNPQDLATCVSEQLNLTIIVLSDESFGMIDWKQKKVNKDNKSTDFINPDFNALSKAFNITFFEVSLENSLPNTLVKSSLTQGVSLIKVPLNYYENNITISEKLQNTFKLTDGEKDV